MNAFDGIIDIEMKCMIEESSRIRATCLVQMIEL